MTRRATESAKAKKMMSRSKAIQERQMSAIDEKSMLLKNIEQSDKLKISPLKFHTSNLITLENVSIFYGKKVACENISLQG